MIFPDASEIFPFPSETNFPHLRSRRNSKTLKIFLPSSNLNRFEFFAKRKVAEFQSIVWMSKNRLIRKIIYYIYRIKFDCHSSIGDWYFGKSRNFIFSQTSVSHSHYVCCPENSYPFLAWLRICSMSLSVFVLWCEETHSANAKMHRETTVHISIDTTAKFATRLTLQGEKLAPSFALDLWPRQPITR